MDLIAFFESNIDFLKLLGISLLVCAGFWILGSLLSRKVAPLLEKHIDGKKHDVFLILVRGFKRPVNVYCKVAGVCIGLLILCHHQLENAAPALLRLTEAAPAFLYQALRIMAILMVTWGMLASSSISGLLLRNARHRLDLHMSKSVARFLSAIFNVVILAVAAVIILSELNYDINGLIAGLGLGGLTIALAAKDSAANFFGGLILVMEKPFEIGDWIVCDNEKVEGTVEDINLRSTTIRTAPGALTVVPNANLSGAPITNWSGGMEKRRADFVLNLTYAMTRQKMQDYTSAVRTMLETDPEIVTDSVIVRFAAFSESSLDVQIQFYTTLPGFADHLRIKERVNYALMELATEYGVEFAYPTRTLYVQEEETRP